MVSIRTAHLASGIPVLPSSILGAGGHQPMSYGDGRWWLTFNGEIYNFLELREELSGLGHHFKSESD